MFRWLYDKTLSRNDIMFFMSKATDGRKIARGVSDLIKIQKLYIFNGHMTSISTNKILNKYV